ncbi:teichoic acid ABC transporter permease [Bacillus sp. MUM 116]|uniref:ABC transporter permease n=1 Tax=Bacillus sp. MUM 116 TaxID=1678002 RepID=UPI0008F55906|nr:ABC transporter permease [Bacillus sp. MUM 116]OIK16337.1 teichoic acid ABC transporter permease [Bacillus sp. MUM 116]
MNSMFTVIREQINSFYLIRRLSLFELKSTNNSHYLGMLWEILNPMIQIGIYWFVFGYGIRNGRSVDGTPYFYWMLAGISVWFFVSPAFMEASKSIYTRIALIAKMSFPMSVIPTYVIISKFYQHLLLLVIISAIFQFSGFPISIFYLQIPYFMFATIMLVVSVSLITSTLAVIVRDVQMIVQAIVRMLLYLTPILWTPDKLQSVIHNLMKLNPLYYITEGYRAALFGHSWYFIDHMKYSLYFWGLVLVLLFIGSMLHLKFRNQFVDYL